MPTGLTARDEHHGTVYVVSVSGPKMYNVDQKPFMVRMAEDTQLYRVIKVEGMKLTYEARTAVGALYDTFELHKETLVSGEANGLTAGKRGPNRIVEGAPVIPERRR